MYLSKLEVRLDEQDLADIEVGETEPSDWEISLSHSRPGGGVEVRGTWHLTLKEAVENLRQGRMTQLEDILSLADDHGLELVWRTDGYELVGSNY